MTGMSRRLLNIGLPLYPCLLPNPGITPAQYHRPQVQYNAQMVRTWSLLLRSCRAFGYVISPSLPLAQLSASPYLIHPIEEKTAALYCHPVLCLDFVSLYPSLFRSHNLCYSTYVHPDDVKKLAEHDVSMTPVGHVFVKAHLRVREGRARRGREGALIPYPCLIAGAAARA